MRTSCPQIAQLIQHYFMLQASSLVGGIFGGPIAGYVADRWGRKFSLVLNSVPYLVGYFIILSACLATNGIVFKTALIVGRFMGWDGPTLWCQ